MPRLFAFLFLMSAMIFTELPAQSDTIFFSKNYTSVDFSKSIIPLYKYVSDTVYYRGKPSVITVPENIDKAQLAFGHIYFNGWETLKDNNSYFLLAGYKDFNAKIYGDINQNLDFTDDGAPLFLNGRNDSAVIALPNDSDIDASFHISVQFVSRKDEEARERTISFFSNHVNGKGNQILEDQYWLSEVRYNNLISQEEISKGYKIAIHDYNCNGFFNDIGQDKILIAAAGTDFSTSLSKGAFLFDTTTIIRVGQEYYEILHIHPRGDYLVVQPTEKTIDMLIPGDIFPDIKVQTLSGTEVQLYELLAPGKYNLINIWGTWCQGCRWQTPRLLKMDSIYTEQFNIVGFNMGDGEEKAKKYIDENGITWTNCFLNKELHDLIRVDVYPFLLLLNKNKEIVLIQTYPDDIENVLQSTGFD